jgi:hypothetical protein
VPNYKVVLWWIVEGGYGRIIKLYGSQSLWAYYLVLINYGISVYIFLTGVLALSFSLVLRKANERFPPVVLAWFLFPLAVFSAGANPDTRFLMPVLPALAVLIGVWVASLCTAKQLRWFIGLYAIFPLYAVVQYSLNDIVTAGRVGPLNFWDRDNHYLYKPVAADWKNEEIVRTLQTLVKDPKQPLRVALAADEKYFEPNWFNFLAQRQRTGLVFVGIPWGRPDFSLETFVQSILDCDFLIMKSVDSERGSLFVNHVTLYNNDLRTMLQNGQLPFVKVSDHIVTPDGSQVLIYQRVPRSPDLSRQ